MPEATRGLLDTSVVVDHDLVDSALLPDEAAIAAATLAELAPGPHATDDEQEPPLEADSARAYGRVFSAARAAGQSSRTRLADLMIAATAVASDLPLYTRSAKDFAALAGVVTVVKV